MAMSKLKQSLFKSIEQSLPIPSNERAEHIRLLLEDRDSDEVASLVAALVEVMTHYTSACDEAVFLHLATNNIYPHQIDALNLPSLKGALNGYLLAQNIDESKVCETCAFRLGTLGNCSESTQDELEGAALSGDVFYCHDDSDGETKCAGKACQGWVQFNRKASSSGNNEA